MRVALLVLLAGCRSILGIEDGVIREQPSAIVVAFESAMSVADEATGTTQIKVRLSEPSADEIAVDVVHAGGSASAGIDFAFEPMTLVFPPGTTEQTVSIAITADSMEEPDEDVELELVDAMNATIDGQLGSHVVSIRANVLPRVQIAASAASGEDAGSVMIAVSLDTRSALPVTVDLVVTGTATANDYTFSAGQVTIEPNTFARQLTIAIVSDALDEDNETIVLTLSNPTNALLGPQITHTRTIQDDDSVPTIAFTLATASSPEEDADTLLATLSLSAPSGRTVTASIGIGGNASANTDYQVLGGASALLPTFAPGELTKTVQVKVLDDTIAEPDETAALAILGSPTNATVGTPSTWTLTIVDNE